MNEQYSIIPIAPPFPDPNRWGLINKEQEKSGIIKWTVLKNKQTLLMTENIKQHINDYNNNTFNNVNNIEINDKIININNYDNDDNDNDYEEILEMNPVWVNQLASTVQKLNNRHKKKSNKSYKKNINKK